MPVAEIAGQPLLPEGLSLREVVDRADLDRIAALEEAISRGEDHGWLAESLEAAQAVDPEALSIVVVQADSEIVCAGWVRFEQGTDFATLWGGATLPAWRRRGIYRATVVYRANLAAERGFQFISVDASADSRPILQRLGFVAVRKPPRTSGRRRPFGQQRLSLGERALPRKIDGGAGALGSSEAQLDR